MKEELFSIIDGYSHLAVELETGLCKRPALSPVSGGEGELDKCLYLEGWLKSHGIKDLERLDAPYPTAKGGVRPNLIATIPGKSDEGSRLWIMSHLDVVPPGELSLWEGDPWKVAEKDDPNRGKLLVGRGVEDNQQGICSSVLAALALADAGLKPPHTVKLLFVSDEENGSEYGAQWLTENCNIFRREDIMLVPDAGSITGDAIEVAEKNIYWVEFTVSGVQAHASRPDNGVNAALAGAELAVRLHDELMAKFDARDPLFEPPFSTFEPTRKSANVPNINTIPGEDIFCVDMRILPCYPIKTVEAEIDRIKREVESKRGVKISAKVHQSMESKPTPQDCRLVRLLSRVVKETYGVETKAIGIGGGTVASYFRNQDIEAAVWCTENGTAHQPNEFTTLANILGDAKVMALLMLDA